MNVFMQMYGSFDLKLKTFRVAVVWRYDLRNLIVLRHIFMTSLSEENLSLCSASYNTSMHFVA